MICLVNAFSLLQLLPECQMPVNKWLYEEWKVCTQSSVFQFAQPGLWQQKSIYDDCLCTADYVRISKKTVRQYYQTKRVAFVNISSHNASFMSNHFKFISFTRHTV